LEEANPDTGTDPVYAT